MQGFLCVLDILCFLLCLGQSDTPMQFLCTLNINKITLCSKSPHNDTFGSNLPQIMCTQKFSDVHILDAKSSNLRNSFQNIANNCGFLLILSSWIYGALFVFRLQQLNTFNSLLSHPRGKQINNFTTFFLNIQYCRIYWAYIGRNINFFLNVLLM